MDKQTKFFKSTILLQFFPIALLGIFLYSKFERQEVLNIPELHPNEFIIGTLFPVIFFVMCCLFSIPYLFSKKDESESTETDVQKKLRLKNFWKFSFYTNSVLLIIASLFLAIINFQNKEEFVIAGDETIYLFIFFQALFIVLISLILASFMLSSGVYWKTNKGLALTTLLLGFGFFVSGICFDFMFISYFKRLSDNHYYLEESPVEEATEVVEVSIDESEYQEEESIEDQEEATEIEKGWSFFLNRRYDLKGNDRFTEVRFPMYSNFEVSREEDDDYFLSNYVKKIRKSPETISLAFETYKYVLYNSVSKRTYRIANFDKVIDALLFTYEDLESDENAGNKAKIYKIMTAEREGYDLDAGDYYPELEKYFTPETIELLESTRLSNGSQFSNGDIVWFYSFWARRNHEKNSDEVVSILREIKENYN